MRMDDVPTIPRVGIFGNSCGRRAWLLQHMRLDCKHIEYNETSRTWYTFLAPTIRATSLDGARDDRVLCGTPARRFGFADVLPQDRDSGRTVSDPGSVFAACACGAPLDRPGSTSCQPCVQIESRSSRPKRHRRRHLDLSATTGPTLVQEGRAAVLDPDTKLAAQHRAGWRRIVAFYGPSGSTGLELDLSLPLAPDVVETIMWAELRSFGIDTSRTYAKDAEQRLPRSTLSGAMACLDWKSQLEGHAPAFAKWRKANDAVWKKLTRSFLTPHARNAATPMMIDEMMRLSAWLMGPTPQTVRSAGLVALALDPTAAYENGSPVGWSWLSTLQAEHIVDLGDAGMRLRATDRVERTVVLSPGPTADAVRAAATTRRPPLRDDAGRIVVVGGVIQRVSYSGPLWSVGTKAMTAQGIRDHVAAVVDRVVPDVDRITATSGVTKLFRVDAETRERAIMRAGEPSSERLRDAAWISNAWWTASRGMEMLSRQVRHATVTDDGVRWHLPRKTDSDGRRPFFGAPHVLDKFVDPRQLLLWWLERLQEEWLTKREQPLPDDAPCFPNRLSAGGLSAVPKVVSTPNARLRRYIAEYNDQVEPEHRLEGHVTTHSLRAGFAVCGRAWGLPTETVMMGGDWNDVDSFLMYLRRAAPLSAGEAGLSMAIKAGLSGVTAEQSLLDRVRGLVPDADTGRLCGHSACLRAAGVPVELLHHSR